MLRALDGTVRKATDINTATQSKSVREKNQTDIKIPITLTPAQQHSFKSDFSCHWSAKREILCLQCLPLFLKSLVDSRDGLNEGISVLLNHAQL